MIHPFRDCRAICRLFRLLTTAASISRPNIGQLTAYQQERNQQMHCEDQQKLINDRDQLLQKGLFHRADKVYKTKPDKKKKKEDEDKESKPKKKESKQDDKEAKKSESSEKKDERVSKRKFKLEMSENQFFVDGDNVYVWIYDPMPWYKIVIGTLLVVGSIGVCLFPLWPPFVRDGFYYVFVGLAFLLGALLGLGVVRAIIFATLWLSTGGSISFWLFPNLFAECGVLESFQPTYELTRNKSKTKKKSDKKQDEPTAQEDETAPPPPESPDDDSKVAPETQKDDDRRASSDNSSNSEFEIVDAKRDDTE